MDIVKDYTRLQGSRAREYEHTWTGAGTLVRGNNSQSEVTKRLVLDISVCSNKSIFQYD